MIDVMKKLQEIAEAGYDNEDIQRGIDAAGKHVFKKKAEPIIEGDIPPGLKAYQDKQNKKKGDKPEAEDDEEEAVEEGIFDRFSKHKIRQNKDAQAGILQGDYQGTAEYNGRNINISLELDFHPKHGDIYVADFEDSPNDPVGLGKTPKQAVNDLVVQADGGESRYPDSDFRSNAMEEGQMKALEGADDGVEEVHEDEIDEAVVEVPVNELAELMQLAGYTDYAEKIEEYANEPEEDYMDAEEQLIGLSGGLNGPKKMYAAAAGGDNPMDQEPREVTESTFESFYKKYDKFVAELTESEQDK